MDFRYMYGIATCFFTSFCWLAVDSFIAKGMAWLSTATVVFKPFISSTPIHRLSSKYVIYTYSKAKAYLLSLIQRRLIKF